MQLLSGPLEREHRLVFAQGIERLVSSGSHAIASGTLSFRCTLQPAGCCRTGAPARDGRARARSEVQPGRRCLAVRLAWHFEAAGMAQKAAGYLQQAGERAERLSAPQEAIGHYQRALALLASLPETDVRTSQELALLIGLGQQFLASKGYAHPDVQRIHDRARSLCGRIGRSSQWVRALSGLGLFYSIRAEYGVARELYEQILDQPRAPATLRSSRWLIGSGLLGGRHGRICSARVHLERALAAFDPGGNGTGFSGIRMIMPPFATPF